ncbi:hypothetical protein C0991_006796 [Blastosporella zonata]|nr:hypothetical protein C0991_006796 [Blastosporella zonata]
MTKPTRSKKPTAKVKEDVATTTTRVPNIEWMKNPDWTWSLIAYLTDHLVFRLKLFSDSTVDATKEGRSKAVGKDGRPQQYATLAQHVFATESTQATYYAQSPARFVTSVETQLRRLKKDYGDHCKTIGNTGAGLHPDNIVPGTPLANIVGTLHSQYATKPA